MGKNAITLDGIFCSGMVLQRDRETKLWGWLDAEDGVTALLDGEPCAAEHDGGRFTVKLPPMPASTGHTVTVKCGEQELTLNDVCFGDVYLLSGQSNMQLTCDRVTDLYGEELCAADYPLIRHFTVEPRYSFGKPLDDIVPAEWKKAVWPDVLGFSAAGFFFAREMYRGSGVPIGLVLNAMGGAKIEAWMPERSVRKFYDCGPEIDKYKEEGALEREVSMGERREAEWRAALDKADEGTPLDSIPDGVVPFTVPGMSFGTVLNGWTGSVYFYREVTLEKEPEGEGLLYAGNSVESDRSYINGVMVGETGYRYPPRKYIVPAGVLKKGVNLIAERMLFNNGVGGFVDGHPYFLSSGSEKADISGTWYMKKGSPAQPLEPTLFPPLLATGLYNASLLPLAGLQFAALLWYQGESNCNSYDEAARYDEKFAEMMRDWRSVLGQKLPVVCVEMCDFDDPAVEHHDPSGWQRIQSQQREAPKIVPYCAVAIAHDLSEPWELHPQRKKELGERLAQQIIHLTSGE